MRNILPLSLLPLLVVALIGCAPTVFEPADDPEGDPSNDHHDVVVLAEVAGCHPTSIAINTTTVVWSARCDEGKADLLHVFAVDKEGGAVAMLADRVSGFGDVAADDDAAYLGTWGMAGEAPALLRKTFDEEPATALVAGAVGEVAPFAIALDDEHVYFADFGKDVARVAKAGGPREAVLDHDANAIVIRDGRMYASMPGCGAATIFCSADAEPGRIVNASVGGGGLSTVVDDAHVSGALAVGSQGVFWAGQEDLRATTNAGTRVIDAAFASAIAVDEDGLVFAAGSTLPNGENGSPLKFVQPLAITCEEVFLLGEFSGRVNVARVRLDSLGPGAPPD